MIIGKNAAIKGFALFLWTVVLILILIGGFSMTPKGFIVPVLCVIALNGWFIWKLFKKWSDKNDL